jgi:cytochrome c biogenesis protein CcdA/thiol-disulfide isomerase/thioredoxin
MEILLFFAFLSGLVTIAAPCIWPILPIILSSSATGGKSKPLGVTIGVMVSFAFFTLALSYIVRIIPFDPNVLRIFAAVVIAVLGLSLVLPPVSARIEAFVSALTGKVSSRFSNSQDGFLPGFFTGAALGLIWSPCAGPILATIATLAATRAINLQIVLVTFFYVLGIGIPLFLFAYLGQQVITKSRWLSPHTGQIQQIFGVIMIITAAAIFFNLDKTLEANLLNKVPSYSNFLNGLEGNNQVTQQLNNLKGNGSHLTSSGTQAPEFAGITNWLNSPPLTMSKLKGKVVLVDFWTYTCINCIRTLPFVTSWYNKYKDEGFVVIGVHTPEFEFEKNTQNVQNAINEYKITYPVAQDNNYGTWNAYNNEYWPADYLIDANGKIRDSHFGEGDYDKTEQAIKQLLQEKGSNVDQSLVKLPDQTPNTLLSPETYIGLARMARFHSPEIPTSGTRSYSAAQNLPQDYFDFSGRWNEYPEYGEATNNSTLNFHFQAGNVYLVMTPKTNQDMVNVLLDGKTIDPSVSGKDVLDGHILFRGADTYNLVDLHGKVESHILTLQFKTAGTQVFAFTFGD